MKKTIKDVYSACFADYLIQIGFVKTDRKKIKKLLDKTGNKDFDLEKANLEFCNIILPKTS